MHDSSDDDFEPVPRQPKLPTPSMAPIIPQKRPGVQSALEKEPKRPKLIFGSQLAVRRENTNFAVAQQLMKQQAYFQELQVKQQLEFQKTIAKMFE